MAKYPDLKSYLQANYKDLLTDAVQKFVDGNYDGGGFHSINVLSLLRHEIENLEVKALTCHDAPGPLVKMDVGVSADIVELGLGTSRYEADRKQRWFKVYTVYTGWYSSVYMPTVADPEASGVQQSGLQEMEEDEIGGETL